MSRKERKGRAVAARVLSALALLAGVALVARPAVTEAVVAHMAHRAISEIEAVYDAMDDEDRAENLAQAEAYNDRLAGRPVDMEVWDYDTQLTYHDEPSTMMAWVEIPKIGSRLPVYHHATEAVLMAGVGHIETSALPVGGEGTLCALSGHSGMPNARMFDDIRALGPGDGFVVWTLGEPHAYRVCSVDVVEPDDVGVLDPVPGRDLCELITCTPLNVNTHRLVVTGERCAYAPEAAELKPGVETVANGRTLPLMAAAALVFAALTALAVLRRRRRVREGMR